MSKLQKLQSQVNKAVKLYCQEKEITQNQLATRIGVSAATISKVVNEKWETIDEKMLLQIWNYVNPEHLEGIIETQDFKSVFTLCQNAIAKRHMAGLIADTGMGKTTALQIFARRKNVYIYYIDSTITPKVFLRDLLRELSVAFEGSLNDMLSRAVQELNTQHEPLLLIDESAKLSDKMMLLLHSLRDRTKGNLGIVLAGMPDFKNKLIKHANKGTTGYSEFFRRIQIWHELKGLSNQEVKFILEHNGISDGETQREFRNYKKFGDLMNEIQLYKEINEL